jgi:hypothetical protein
MLDENMIDIKKLKFKILNIAKLMEVEFIP